jgi:hypothetical protein
VFDKKLGQVSVSVANDPYFFCIMLQMPLNKISSSLGYLNMFTSRHGILSSMYLENEIYFVLLLTKLPEFKLKTLILGISRITILR